MNKFYTEQLRQLLTQYLTLTGSSVDRLGKQVGFNPRVIGNFHKDPDAGITYEYGTVLYNWLSIELGIMAQGVKYKKYNVHDKHGTPLGYLYSENESVALRDGKRCHSLAVCVTESVDNETIY